MMIRPMQWILSLTLLVSLGTFPTHAMLPVIALSSFYIMRSSYAGPHSAGDRAGVLNAGILASPGLPSSVPTTARSPTTPVTSPDRLVIRSGVNAVPDPKPAASPGGNRAAFMQKFSPTRTVCNQDLCRVPPGTKVSICAVVIAVFPATTNPDRRYVQLADATGSVGITVWNENVSRFSRNSIGQVVVGNKIVSGSHQGKKVLTMTRESTMDFPTDHTLYQWWANLLTVPPPTLAAVQDMPDNTITNVAGVLGMTTEEVKMVGSVQKVLTTLHLGDPSGELAVKSWNHRAADFAVYLETPILIQRVRITSFADRKTAEYLDNMGSVVVAEFPGKAMLAQYWAN